jgi:hypothetical protein
MKARAFLLFFLSVATCSGQSGIESKKFSPEELKQDLSYLFERLESIHPSLYCYTSKEKLSDARAAVEEELTHPMTRVEFARKSIPLVAMLKNGHTSLSFPQEELTNFFNNGGTVFPFTVLIKDKRIFVAANHSEDQTIEPFTEILTINGIPSTTILNSLRRYISAELDAYRDIRVQQEFGNLFRYLYGFDKEYEFELALNGNSFKKKMTGLIQKEIRDAILKSRSPDAFRNYSYRKLENGIGLIDFRSMVNRKEFQSFIKSTFAGIKKDQIKHLIIDVRNNSGGDSQLGDDLFDYITSKPYRQEESEEIKTSREMKQQFRQKYWKWYMYFAYPIFPFHPYGRAYILKRNGSITTWDNMDLRTPKGVQNKFKGKTYLLTSRQTFSSANMLAAAFKCYSMGTIIGEETGEPLTNFGDVIFFVLPNTKLLARCSHKKIVLACGSDCTNGVIPDIEIIPSDEDILIGRDAAVEYIKQTASAK